jgi:hypothetical protein
MLFWHQNIQQCSMQTCKSEELEGTTYRTLRRYLNVHFFYSVYGFIIFKSESQSYYLLQTMDLLLHLDAVCT